MNAMIQTATSTAMKFVAKTKLFCVAKSPEILAVTGIVGIGIGVVMACVATTKIDNIAKQASEEINEIKNGASEQTDADTSEETVEKQPKNGGKLAKIYAKTALRYIRLYAPSALIIILACTSLLASNRILKARNASLMAAYTALDATFNRYRGNVIERYGKEVDEDLRYSLKKINTVEQDENGNQRVVEKKVTNGNVDKRELSRYFGRGNDHFTNNDYYNENFVKSVEQMANDKLVRDGHVFLGYVYELLGFEPSLAGQQCGWAWDYKDLPNDPVKIKVNYVEGTHNFDDCYEAATLLLDFDGVKPIMQLFA